MTVEQKKLYDSMMAPLDLLEKTCAKHCEDHGQKSVSLIVLNQFIKVIKKSYKQGFEKNKIR